MIKPNSNDSYRRFIAHLGILYMRAQYNKDQQATNYYKNIYEKLELIQERRHLALLGEKSKEKNLYEEILQVVEKIYQGEEKQDNAQDFQNAIEEVETLLNKYNIELEQTKKEKSKEEKEK